MKKLILLIISCLMLCGCMEFKHARPLEEEPMHRYDRIENGIYNWERFPEVGLTPAPHY